MIRLFLARILGKKVIRLIDYDGQKTIRWAKEIDGKLYFVRMFSCGRSRAYPNGATSKSYVKKWEPLYGFESKAHS